MARNTKEILVDGGQAGGHPRAKDYRESSFMVKKNQQARETLQKFPVPEKYAKELNQK